MRPTKLLSLLILMSFFAQSKDVAIIDVRTDGEWQNGHLQSAVHIPLSKIEEEIKTLGYSKNQEIYLYCRSGNRSGKAEKILRKLGYLNAQNIGGIDTASKQLKLAIIKN